MSEKWKFNRFRDRLRLVVALFTCLSLQSFAFSLNDEGLALLRFKERVVSDPFNALGDWRENFGEANPCFWFGVECSQEKVVVLNLKDLCLGGTLGSELRQLVHLKSIVLRNNSFTGVIPEEISDLEELEVLDLGFNNFTGPVPANLGSNLSLTILLLDNNVFLDGLAPELHGLKMVSEFQVDEDQLYGAAKKLSCNQRPIVWNLDQAEATVDRRVLQQEEAAGRPPPPQESQPSPVNPDVGSPKSFSPSPSPSSSGKTTASPTAINSPSLASSPSPSVPSPQPVPSSTPPPVSATTQAGGDRSSRGKNNVALVAGAVGGSAAVVIVIVAYLLVKTKVTNVNPWATGLSGQLKKALVTGVPKLKRSELETACEDFSNVIGSSSIGTLYKGTLSSGVEIAVAIVPATTAKDWSENLEMQFLKKIDTLSKLNHKNFVNLIGYCREDEPFTRMMVFEYAPSGTLFEHLHIREAEHLDWGMRLRIAMGMAYCLDYMHQLEQPIPHNNLNSSAIRLTEDYATKIAEFTFWNEIATGAPTKAMGSSKRLTDTPSTSPDCNVYSFGVILFEMVTGRVPYSVEDVSLENWASDYLTGVQPLKEMVDPTLRSYNAEQLEEIGQVIKSCVQPDPRRRPQMRDICIRLREVTGITPDGASPRISPLWWAELELMSDAM